MHVLETCLAPKKTNLLHQLPESAVGDISATHPAQAKQVSSAVKVMEENPVGYLDVSDVGPPNDSIVSVNLSQRENVAGVDFVDEIIEDESSEVPVASPSGEPGSELTGGGSAIPTTITSSVPSDELPSDYTAIPSALPSLRANARPETEQIELSSISGNVKEDIDSDGNGDANLRGVTITLLLGSETVAILTTDDEGDFAFYDLPEGDYTILEWNLVGYVDVLDTEPPNDNMIFLNLGPAAENSTGKTLLVCCSMSRQFCWYPPPHFLP